jgi:hypothetical protein
MFIAFGVPALGALIYVLSLLLIAACASPSYRAELFVPSDAQQIHVEKNYDTGVSYVVLRVYPAQEFLIQLNEHFASHGFHPANPDIFFQETSHSRGWGNFTDGRNAPETHVAQWGGIGKTRRVTESRRSCVM